MWLFGWTPMYTECTVEARMACQANVPEGDTDSVRPLSGIRVLEFCSFVAGPVIGRNLALLGADVVKVERPDGGDDGRQMSPTFDGEGLFFTETNAGKRSIVLDLKTDAGKRVARDLVGQVDVVLENMRPGAMASLGLDPAQLAAEFPHLVIGSLNGFGDDPTRSQEPSYDPIIQAATGLMFQQSGGEGKPPIRVGASIVDKSAGLWATIEVLAMLLSRQKTGRGGHFTTSLVSAGVHIMGAEILRFVNTGRDFFDPPRDPDMGSVGAHLARDGKWLQVSPANDRLFPKLCHVLGAPHLLDDPRFVDGVARGVNRIEEQREMKPLFAQRDRDEWIGLLRAAGVPCSPVNNISDFMSDPAFPARFVGSATRTGGPNVPLIRSPLDSPDDAPARLPRLGEDTGAVLRTILDMDDGDLVKLSDAGAFGNEPSKFLSDVGPTGLDDDLPAV